MSIDQANQFLNSPYLTPKNKQPLKYICFSGHPKDMTKSFKNKKLEIFFKMLAVYDPLEEFILLTTIETRKKDTNLNQLQAHENFLLKDDSYFMFEFVRVDMKLSRRKSISTDLIENAASTTLILTSFVKEESTAEKSLEDRQLFLANVITEFVSRGICIRTQYSELYKKLCLYAEENLQFSPMCLFPRDLNNNSLFLCLILPNSEQIKAGYC